MQAVSLESSESDGVAAYRRLFDLSGRTALVTGPAAGSDGPSSLGLAAFGCDVAAHFRSRARQSMKSLRQSGVPDDAPTAISADLTIAGEGRRLARSAVTAMGRSIDIVIANASVENRAGLRKRRRRPRSTVRSTSTCDRRWNSCRSCCRRCERGNGALRHRRHDPADKPEPAQGNLRRDEIRTGQPGAEHGEGVRAAWRDRETTSLPG